MRKVGSALATTPERAAMMRNVATRDTEIELAVRRLLHAHGFRYALHRGDLAGKPDIALAKYKTAVFVHGCFWHGHACKRGVAPKTNRAFWTEKIERNRARDRRVVAALRRAGWSVTTVWACRIEPATRSLIARLECRRDA